MISELIQRVCALHLFALAAIVAAITPQSYAADDRAPLYYQDPDGKAFYSAGPKMARDGRAFVPVFSDRPSGKPSANQEDVQPIEPASSKGRILYYRNPMGLPDTSPVPKKDSMGMDYIPVYENEAAQESGVVQISPAKLQMLGVRTSPVELRTAVTQTLRATATLQWDERRIATVTARTGGWIEKIRIATGEPVKRGDPLFEFFSPELASAEEEYLATVGDRSLADAALQRLRALGIADSEVERLAKSRKAMRTIPIASPIDGVVTEQQVTQGARVEPDMPLYRIADLTSLWLIAEVPEQDTGKLKPGQNARASFAAFPGREFSGTVEFIYPSLSSETRTSRVRIALANPDQALRAGMFASVAIETSEATAREVLAVPDSAIIDSGSEQVVLVEKGEGSFEPRRVRLGARGDGVTEVLQGVEKGERVVVGANFLIDSESNLRAALQAFGNPAPAGGPSQ